eukprot:591624-Hanusia_phi.AAC.2
MLDHLSSMRIFVQDTRRRSPTADGSKTCCILIRPPLPPPPPPCHHGLAITASSISLMSRHPRHSSTYSRLPLWIPVMTRRARGSRSCLCFLPATGMRQRRRRL